MRQSFRLQVAPHCHHLLICATVSRIPIFSQAIMSDFSSPLYKFGIIADPQYVDAEDGTNHDKTLVRRYRQSFQTLKEACSVFATTGTAYNVVLGDTLDGKAGSLKMHDRCIDEILIETKEAHPEKWHFAVGNHDLYCFTRDALREILYSHVTLACMDTSVNKGLYYDFSPYPGFRFIMLDAFDVSEMNASTPENQAQAVALLCAKNPNIAAGRYCWLEGISDEDARYTPANGAVSSEQLTWLRGVLEQARQSNEKCIVFSHVPTYLPSTQPSTILWNCEQVLELLQAYPHVVAYFAGHDHDGGYAVDDAGIHHVVPPAPLECDEGEVAYGWVEVYPDRMELVWTGKKPARTSWPTTMRYRDDI